MLLKNITSKESCNFGLGRANPKHDPNSARKCTRSNFQIQTQPSNLQVEMSYRVRLGLNTLSKKRVQNKTE